MNKVVSDFVTGIKYFFNGIFLLSHKELRRYILLPLLVNIIFFAVPFAVLIHYYANIDLYIVHHLPPWLSVLSILAKLFVFFIYIVIMLYSFFTVATIIAAPFNGYLAEKVALQKGHLLEEKSWTAILCDTPRLIGRQLMILVLYVPIALLLTVLLLVPLLHALILVIWIWFHARMMALIYLDYPTDNAGVSLQSLRMWMSGNKALVFGFGGSVLMFSAIPILNFFVIPASVIAATHIWVDKGQR